MSLHDILLAKALSGGGSGGGADIDVTASVGQTIVVEEVDANGKPTKWKAAEYQPRTHYEIDNVPYVPETTVTEWEDGVAELVGRAPLVEGETYTVNYNGAAYECVCVFVEDMGATCVGDFSGMRGGESTGEPFVVLSMFSDGEILYGLLPMDGATPVTISIVGKEIVTIPDKYLSDVAKPLYIETFGEPDESLTIAPEYLLSQYKRGRTIFARYQGFVEIAGGTTISPLLMPMVSIEDDGSVVWFSATIMSKIVTLTLTATDGVYTPAVEIVDVTQ